jgi:hypothetical protein
MSRQNDDAPALPQNIEAERSVLGAILLDNAALESAHLIPKEFFHEHHRRIFSAMLAMHSEREPIDLVTITEFLQAERSLEAAGGAAYVSALMDGVPNVTNVGHYAAIVKEKARLRAIIHHAAAVQRAALDPANNADDVERLLTLNASELQATAHANGNGNGHLGSSLVDFMAMEFPPPEHLVEGLIPRGGSILIVALPHRMKSWFTTSLALACTREGTALGKLEVNRPIRTMLVQVEDHESIVKQRIGSLITTTQFMGCDPEGVWVVKRSDFQGFTTEWCARLKRQAIEWKADLIILDVLRRLFQGHGDLNSPGDSASFLERIDEIRDESGAAIALVHHENKKDADLMNASAGSYNFPGWANVVIQLKRKTMSGSGAAQITHVEIEVDNKLGVSAEPLRMVLDLASPTPVRLEALEDGDGLREALLELDTEWNVRNLCEVMGIHRTSATRRLKKWMDQGKVEKIRGGKKGRAGGLAMYRAIESAGGE